jgi:4-hydroxy-4-methyl-2-oxoglutarate aldolase
MNADALTHVQIDRLRRLSTCVVASTIETFRVRLPNTGFADSRVRCMFEDRHPVVGFAATARIRSATPPMEGHGYYYDRMDWWNHILRIPTPRIVVIEDVDARPGLGAFVGEVNANILLALGCVALVTNGAVRDLGAVAHTEFQMFAGSAAVSHAYAHVFDFGSRVEVGGLPVKAGGLVHGDRHGVQTIPIEISGDIPARADEILRQRRELVELCRSEEFSIEKLREAVRARRQI